MGASDDAVAAAHALRAAEATYPGSDLTARQGLALDHVRSVVHWFYLVTAPAGPTVANAATDAVSAVSMISASQVLTLHPDVAYRDGAGLVALPAKQMLIAKDAPLFTAPGIVRLAQLLAIRPLNPLVTLRWTLTDLLLRYAAQNVSMLLTVVDYKGNVIVAPYARGFAIGSGAVYSRAYTYGQPTVNVGFDNVSVKVMASLLCAGSQLSYAANITTMAPFRSSVALLNALLTANTITVTMWQRWYQSSSVAAAAVALTRGTHRAFKPDLDPSHVGANVDRNSYGYGIMKAISMRDTVQLAHTLRDFTLPALRSIPTFTVPA